MCWEKWEPNDLYSTTYFLNKGRSEKGLHFGGGLHLTRPTIVPRASQRQLLSTIYETISKPVCCLFRRVSKLGLTKNKCLCEARGIVVDDHFCSPVGCPHGSSTVCCLIRETRKPRPIECRQGCENKGDVVPDVFCKPPPICPSIYSPVCCKVQASKFITSRNECVCRRIDNGYVVDTGPCPPPKWYEDIRSRWYWISLSLCPLIRIVSHVS